MSNLQLFNKQITNPKTQEYLVQVLGEKKSSFVNNITALVANSKNLQECEPMSLMFAGIKSTALDLPLDPNLGFAYVIPFRNSKSGMTDAQFQIGYKGFIQLAIRSGQFKTINVTEIKEGELVSRDLLSGDMEFKAIDNRENLPTIGFAAYFKLLNGFEKTFYMTVGEMEAHAKQYSQTYGSKNDWTKKSSKWTTDFSAMGNKTALKLLLNKYAPLSVEMRDAINSDQAVLSEKGNKYVDNDIEPEPMIDPESASKISNAFNMAMAADNPSTNPVETTNNDEVVVTEDATAEVGKKLNSGLFKGTASSIK